MRAFILVGVLMNLASYANAQDITRVLPNGTTIDRVPGQGITISRETPRRSFSFSVGRGNAPTATASASATGTNFAYASARTSTAVRTNSSGQSIDIARARANAVGNISTSTTAHTSF